MSDEELNLWIAEFIDPKEGSVWDTPGQRILTCAGGWMWVDGHGREPRAFCSDPACTVMLMERMIDKYTDCRKGLDLIADRFQGHPPFGGCLRRAVAEAFAIASGLDASRVEK